MYSAGSNCSDADISVLNVSSGIGNAEDEEESDSSIDVPEESLES